MPIEIIGAKNKNGRRTLDQLAKDADEEVVILIEDLALKSQVCKLARRSFKALNGRSHGRIDIKMGQNGAPNFVEANLIPGLGKGYFYRSCVLNLKMTYDEMILKIAEIGLALNR